MSCITTHMSLYCSITKKMGGVGQRCIIPSAAHPVGVLAEWGEETLARDAPNLHGLVVGRRG